MSSTRVGITTWIKLHFYKWHISRHGYRIYTFNTEKFHELDVSEVELHAVLDLLIRLAERDYLEEDAPLTNLTNSGDVGHARS